MPYQQTEAERRSAARERIRDLLEVIRAAPERVAAALAQAGRDEHRLVTEHARSFDARTMGPAPTMTAGDLSRAVDRFRRESADVSKVRRRAWAKVDEVRSEAEKAQAKLDRIITEALRPSSSTPVEAAVELQRTWGRLERQLASGVEPSELIARVGQTGDTMALQALRDELPAWLEAKHRNAAKRTEDKRLAATEAAKLAVALSSEIDRAELPLLEGDKSMRLRREALLARLEAPARARELDARLKVAALPPATSPRTAVSRRLAAAYATNDARRAAGDDIDTPRKQAESAGSFG